MWPSATHGHAGNCDRSTPNRHLPPPNALTASWGKYMCWVRCGTEPSLGLTIQTAWVRPPPTGPTPRYAVSSRFGPHSAPRSYARMCTALCTNMHVNVRGACWQERGEVRGGSRGARTAVTACKAAVPHARTAPRPRPPLVRFPALPTVLVAACRFRTTACTPATYEHERGWTLNR